MIARGSTDEAQARHHLAHWHGMVGYWNAEADSFRRAARGETIVAPHVLVEAERTRDAVREALSLCDALSDSLPPGHELLGELFQMATTLDAIGESLDRSVEGLGPRIEAGREIAGLRFLVSALRQDAGLAGQAG